MLASSMYVTLFENPLLTSTAQGVIFLCIYLAFQGLLTYGAYRLSGSVALAALAGFLPPLGIPLLIIRLRHRLRDNHLAGALTYLVLLICAFGFLVLTEEELSPWHTLEDPLMPWALLHTMQFFGFLGLANLLLTPLKEE